MCVHVVSDSLLLEVLALFQSLTQVFDSEVCHEVDLAVEQCEGARLLRTWARRCATSRARDGGGGGGVGVGGALLDGCLSRGGCDGDGGDGRGEGDGGERCGGVGSTRGGSHSSSSWLYRSHRRESETHSLQVYSVQDSDT